jgi:hypothetical protein
VRVTDAQALVAGRAASGASGARAPASAASR